MRCSIYEDYLWTHDVETNRSDLKRQVTTISMERSILVSNQKDESLVTESTWSVCFQKLILRRFWQILTLRKGRFFWKSQDWGCSWSSGLVLRAKKCCLGSRGWKNSGRCGHSKWRGSEWKSREKEKREYRGTRKWAEWEVLGNWCSRLIESKANSVKQILSCQIKTQDGDLNKPVEGYLPQNGWELFWTRLTPVCLSYHKVNILSRERPNRILWYWTRLEQTL